MNPQVASADVTPSHSNTATSRGKQENSFLILLLGAAAGWLLSMSEGTCSCTRAAAVLALAPVTKIQ
jgi:hypothetical protein